MYLRTTRQRRKHGPDAIYYQLAENYQTPPDLVVKFQRIDIVDVILWLVLRPRIVYRWEIKA